MAKKSEEVVVTKAPVEPTEKSESLIKRIAAEIAPIVKQARALIIRNDTDLQRAGGFLKMVKGFLSDIANGEIGQIDEATKKARQAAIALRKRAEEPLLEAEGILKPKIAAYQRAEIERVERERREATAKEEARLREKAEEDKLTRANQAAEKGDYDAAAEIANEEVEVGHISTANLGVKEAAKVAGVTLGKTWFAEVTDLPALVDAWNKGKVPRLAVTVEPNMVFLNKQAVAFKDTDALAYPGVKVSWKDRVGASG